MGENLKSGGNKGSGLASIALPGQRLAISKNPRALQPFEIDLLRKDLESALKVVAPDEIEDAQGLIRDHRFSIEDFEIVQQVSHSPAHISPITGTVSVTRSSNGLMRSYDAGSGSSWLMKLELDLKSGAFGSP